MKQHKRGLVVWFVIAVLLFITAMLVGSSFTVMAILLITAALIRIFAIPRLSLQQPGRLQLLLEETVGLFDGMAKGSSPHRNRFLGTYFFSAGAFIAVGTLFKLLDRSPAVFPAPLLSLNAAIATGTLSILAIASYGAAKHGPKWVKALKEFPRRVSERSRQSGSLPQSGVADRPLKRKNDFIKEHKKGLAVWLVIVALLFAAAMLVGPSERSETVQEAMRDAVLHDAGQISLFGLKAVNPGMISAFTVTAILVIAAALIRIFAIPRFKLQPGKLQMALEEAVNLFDGMAKGSSPHRNRFLGAYIFSAGAFIFVGTLFELLGLQAITVHGHPITLPAPLSDVNAAIATGTLSYLVIASGGVAEHGPKGVLKALKEFSLPISMSFRLFGALLSGLLVTELVYYFVTLSFVLPVVVGVLFTLLHALIQTYVLTMLVSLYYGEVSEPSHKKSKEEPQSDNP